MEQQPSNIEQSKYQERAHRILDAASDLLVRWGYKRVTIDDIARYAGVGKGTVYLHWKTRDTLFETLMLRESANVLQEVLQILRTDQAEILLHRIMSTFFVCMIKRPLIKALVTRDIELLGKLAQSNTVLQMEEVSILKSYFALLRKHALLLTDVDLDEQFYAFEAVTTGFFLLDQYQILLDPIALEEKERMLARTIRLAFEPPMPPSPSVLQEVAPEVIQYFERLHAQYIQQMQTQTEL